MASLRFAAPPLQISLCALTFLLGAAPNGVAQEPAAPAHVAFVDGSASIDRDGQAQPASAGMPFLPGDRLRTTAGRAELLFPDGSALDVDEYSSIELQSDMLMRLTSGRIILLVAGAENPAAAVRYQIDTPVASANTEGPGEYRVSLLSGPSGSEAELAVLRGAASLRTERGSTPVRAGERSLARDLDAPSFPQAFNSARFDAFDRWSVARRDARMGTATSARYLPRDLQMYGGTFDRYGSWQYEQPHGYVWYPTVAPGWRPYYDGYWSPIPAYGWTWVGLDFYWSWPTHHYGRWGFGRSRWFWIPERRWAPAWVSWGTAPGYVGWCPLGFDNRPVFALNVNIGNPWTTGWVVVPRRHFGVYSTAARTYAIARPPASLPMAVQTSAPVAVPRAVPRGSVIAGGPRGDGAVSRGGRDVAVPRQPGFAGQQPSSASERLAVGRPPAAGVGQPPLAVQRRADAAHAPSARNPRPGYAAPPPVPSSDTLLKRPLPDMPRTWQQRNSGVITPRDPSPDDSPRAIDRSPTLSAVPTPPGAGWYGQRSPWYGPARRPPVGDAPAAGTPSPSQRSSSYSRAPFSPSTARAEAPSATGWAAPGARAVPRWNGSAFGQPSQPGPAQQAAPPQQFYRSAPMRAVPRGESSPPPAAAPPAGPPAGSSGDGGARQGHAPSSRRRN